MIDPYLNAEPFIPLPKVRVNGALVPEQLIMLWWIWAGGMALGMLVFLIEQLPGVKAKENNNGRRKIRQYPWTTGRCVHVQPGTKARVATEFARGGRGGRSMLQSRY